MNFGSVKDLPKAWTEPRTRSRLHLLRAHEAPRAIVIQRKRGKLAHIISWNTETDELEEGSWFTGRIYAERSDLSWDGKWMVYLAMGAKGETWNGICQPPWLKTVADVPNEGTWAGGGVFTGRDLLHPHDFWLNKQSLADFSKSDAVPFKIKRRDLGGEVFPALTYRLERDGWIREGEFGKDRKISLKHSSYSTLCIDDPGWSWRFSPDHPVLRMFYRGYFVNGYTFEFVLEGSELLGPEVSWATWDAKGSLLVAKEGVIYRYSLEALKREVPDFTMDLEGLERPRRESGREIGDPEKTEVKDFFL